MKKGTDTKTSQTFTYDDLGQLASVSGNGVSATYTYDANGNLASAVLGNGVVQTYSYNQSNQITQMTAKKGSTVLSSYSYGYDLAGRRISASDSGKTTQYTYDLLGRLAAETTPEGTTSFTYDARGNRLTSTAGGVTTAYTYDLANRLLTSAANGVTTTYTYDDNGNTLSAQEGTTSAKQYFYNAANQLIGYADLAENIAALYAYQPDGLRKSKTIDDVTTDFVWDGQQLALEETGSASAVYIRGLQLIAQTDGASASDALYYLHDGHGSATRLTNSVGAITGNYQYDAFGNQKNSADDSNPFRYCGEYTDACSGLVYLRNRYYDSSVGRFLTEDPARSGMNWYVYCENDPINFIDSLGLWKHTNEGFEAESGDSLWSLSKLLFGDGTRWTEFGFEGDPESLQVGQVVSVDKTIAYYFYGGDQKKHATRNIRDLRNNGFAVIGNLISSESDFEKAYDAMPGTVSTVIANFHGNSNHVFHINLSKIDMTKNIETFVLLSCNAGHQWTGFENFALRMANKSGGNIGQLIAVDGIHHRSGISTNISARIDSGWTNAINSAFVGAAKSQGFIRYKWNGTSYDINSVGYAFNSVRSLLKKVGVS